VGELTLPPVPVMITPQMLSAHLALDDTQNLIQALGIPARNTRKGVQSFQKIDVEQIRTKGRDLPATKEHLSARSEACWRDEDHW
jgi:hypothetical protein